MGFALAQAARSRGAKVTLLAANVSLPAPPGVSRRDISTAAELQVVCDEEFAVCDVLLMTAAVADFRPAAPRAGKIKKAGRASLELELEATADVLAGLAARRRNGQTLVGFAAEHGAGAIECARDKLTAKRLDAVVVNDISRSDIGFEVDANEVTIVTPADGSAPDGQQHVPRASKAQVAEAILDAVERLRADLRAGA
jgi:phosphopantothenoylcysteine decarboxylase/phosphopantothenate--cysteine ligase